jgi:hypothetical protein
LCWSYLGVFHCDAYLDLYFEIDSEGRWSTKHYDKRDGFNFPFWQTTHIRGHLWHRYQVTVNKSRWQLWNVQSRSDDRVLVLCCMSFFDLRLVITPLIASHFPYCISKVEVMTSTEARYYWFRSFLFSSNLLWRKSSG